MSLPCNSLEAETTVLPDPKQDPDPKQIIPDPQPWNCHTNTSTETGPSHNKEVKGEGLICAGIFEQSMGARNRVGI